MALDALAIRSLTKEIADAVIGGRIDKIHQPEKDEIVLHIRTYENNYKIVLSAGAAHPRLHFTTANKKNPITAPLFCMLLRKHLGSGKIVNVYQIGFERIVYFDIESYDELGDLSVKHLIVEIMGKHSNIILTNSDMKIIDCIKRIDFSVSSVRQVLPGLNYELPPVQDKTPLTEFSGKLNAPVIGGEMASKLLMNSISGISPLTAREIIYSAYQTADLKLSEIKDLTLLENAAAKYSEKVKNNEFKPCMIKDNKASKILDFSSIDIHQYDGFAEVIYGETMSEILDMFYTGRDALERMKQKSADISKLLHNLLERAYKKRLILAKTIEDAKNKDKYKINGDLIMANLYSIEENAKSVEVSNYYEEACPMVKIALDPKLTASQNAQRYYKKYQKAKTAEIEAGIQAKQNDETIDYLESTIVSLDNCKTEADIIAIRGELAELGYIQKRRIDKKKKAPTSKPMHFVSNEGFDIYVGKNNTQNDYLTLKLANTSDIWFHTKLIHGSHTVIKLGLDKAVPEETMRMAAELAAYYSKGRGGSQVPVDYTEIKNVKKPNGAKPGMVIYDSYNTVYVTPNSHEANEIKEK